MGTWLMATSLSPEVIRDSGRSIGMKNVSLGAPRRNQQPQPPVPSAWRAAWQFGASARAVPAAA